MIQNINMKKVIMEIEIQNCKECPCYSYQGTSYSEDVYICTKNNREVDGYGIPDYCPLIESTIERLRLLNNVNITSFKPTK